MSEEQKPIEQKNEEGNTGFEDSKLCAMLAYLLIGIFWYFTDERMKKNEFTKFHVKQGILLIISSLAGSMILGMTIIFAWLIPFFQFCIFIMVIIGCYNAVSNEKKELPIIGKYHNKFNI